MPAKKGNQNAAKPASEVRSERVVLRMTKKEKATAKKNAAKAGLTLTEYGRLRLL